MIYILKSNTYTSSFKNKALLITHVSAIYQFSLLEIHIVLYIPFSYLNNCGKMFLGKKFRQEIIKKLGGDIKR